MRSAHSGEAKEQRTANGTEFRVDEGNFVATTARRSSPAKSGRGDPAPSQVAHKASRIWASGGRSSSDSSLLPVRRSLSALWKETARGPRCHAGFVVTRPAWTWPIRVVESDPMTSDDTWKPRLASARATRYRRWPAHRRIAPSVTRTMRRYAGRESSQTRRVAQGIGNIGAALRPQPLDLAPSFAAHLAHSSERDQRLCRARESHHAHHVVWSHLVEHRQRRVARVFDLAARHRTRGVDDENEGDRRPRLHRDRLRRDGISRGMDDAG